MVRVAFFTFLTTFSALVFGQVPGVTSKTIVFGQSAAFSGPAAQLGILMKKAGSSTQFHNVSFVGSKALSDALKDEGHGVAISQVVPFPWSPSVPIVKEYQEVLKKAGNTDFNFSSLEGFIVGKVMFEGLRRAGKDLTREKLIAGLEGMSNVNVGDFIVNFSPANHSGSKFVDLTMIGRGGKFLR